MTINELKGANSAIMTGGGGKLKPTFQTPVCMAGRRKFKNNGDFFKKEDKSDNGKFDFSEAIKNFGRGVLSPVKAVIEHPVMTAGVVIGTSLVCTAVPVLGAAMTVGFLGASAFQLGKGIYDVAKNIKNKEYDKAEKSFDKVGEGAAGTALGFLGLKHAARVAKEAKMMSKLGTNVLTDAQRAEAAKSVQGNSVLGDLKEIFSLVTTKEGRHAAINEFKPSMIKQRFVDVKNRITGKKEEKETIIKTKKQMTPEEFKKTPEGLRRAALSDEEIEAEVNSLFDKAFDELEIPKEERPKLRFEPREEKHGGAYGSRNHEITYNPNAYRAGVFEIDDTIMHEATHCREALLRAGIPQDRVNEIVREELTKRIKGGESEKILLKFNILGADITEPPKMSSAMQDDFAQIANQYLYKYSVSTKEALCTYCDEIDAMARNNEYFHPEKLKNAKNTLSPLITKLKALMKAHPDFQAQYQTEEEALNALIKYSTSHHTRFTYFTDTSIGSGFDKIAVKPVTGEVLSRAEQSLRDNIATTEGNARISGLNSIFPSDKDFNQYQFSPEEVLAQKNGNGFLIKNWTAKMAEMKAKGALTPEQETYMTSAIEKAKAVIEYKTKGLEYYEKYTQLLNDPNNNELSQAVKALEAELAKAKEGIDSKTCRIVEEIIKTYGLPDRAANGISISAIYELMSKLKEES